MRGRETRDQFFWIKWHSPPRLILSYLGDVFPLSLPRAVQGASRPAAYDPVAAAAWCSPFQSPLSTPALRALSEVDTQLRATDESGQCSRFRGIWLLWNLPRHVPRT